CCRHLLPLHSFPTRRSSDLNATVLENMQTVAQALTDTECRNVLGSFLFSGDDVNKPAGVLSGGEKTRLALAMLVVSSANVLLLRSEEHTSELQSRFDLVCRL